VILHKRLPEFYDSLSFQQRVLHRQIFDKWTHCYFADISSVFPDMRTGLQPKNSVKTNQSELDSEGIFHTLAAFSRIVRVFNRVYRLILERLRSAAFGE
jgi:hypothetical protein